MAVFDIGQMLNQKRREEEARKLAILESQLAEQRTAQAQKGATEQALKIRDSNQLAADYARHGMERETQQAVADQMIATGEYQNDPNLSAEQNRAAAMAQAAEKTAQIKVNQPLAQATSALNQLQQAQATQPYNPELGMTAAQSSIDTNRATSALSNLQRQQYLGGTGGAFATGAAKQKAAEQEATLAGTRAAAMAPVVPSEALAAEAGNREKAAQSIFETKVTGGLSPAAAAEAKNMQAAQTSAIAQQLLQHPDLAKSLWHPNIPWYMQPNAGLGIGGSSVNAPPVLTTPGGAALPINPAGLRPTGRKLGQ